MTFISRNKYVLIICIPFIFLLVSNEVIAQNSELKLSKDNYLDFGLEYALDAGFGGNVGYTRLNVNRGQISHGSFSVLYKDDGIDKWGERYENIGQREFPQDVVDTGYSFLTLSGALGFKITDAVHILGSVEYQMASFVQKRRDDTTILGNNGRYFTEYRDTDKSSFGVGGGVKFFVPISDRLVFTPTLTASTTKMISLSLGLAI